MSVLQSTCYIFLLHYIHISYKLHPNDFAIFSKIHFWYALDKFAKDIFLGEKKIIFKELDVIRAQFGLLVSSFFYIVNYLIKYKRNFNRKQNIQIMYIYVPVCCQHAYTCIIQ